MAIVRCNTLGELKKALDHLRSESAAVGFVPTMGALHAGHISLIEVAKRHSDRVVASIFVNPLQFGPNEDLSKYPRTEEEDIRHLDEAGADIVFLPSVEVMYPKDFNTAVEVSDVSEGLCGACRPGHFKGVATVVARLFGLVQPDIAVFGEKDYQQLQVIKTMVRDLAMRVQIIGAPVVREVDGLAMSSRNRYLNPAQRHIAAQLYAVLNETAERISNAQAQPAEALAWGTKEISNRGFTKVDYLELCDAETLGPLERADRPARLVAAAWLGNTRLIDNIAL